MCGVEKSLSIQRSIEVSPFSDFVNQIKILTTESWFLI